MSYVDTGEGDPVVFLHGNPTSSYLWRNVIPHVAKTHRCLAPDLMGMGRSSKLTATSKLTLAEHSRFLDDWFEVLGLDKNIILVGHDWGGVLGFSWARRHPESVRGIAYMETIVAPMEWSDFPDRIRDVFKSLRSDAGEQMVLDQNLFVERILPMGVVQGLSDAAHAVYRAPFETREDRRVTLAWPRQLPIGSEPQDVVDIVGANEKWLSQSQVPKLFINSEPGALLTGRLREICRGWPNQQEITVVGQHFVQEDAPDTIGVAVAEFAKRDG